MPLTSGSPDHYLRITVVGPLEGEKEAAPAGGESGRRAHGPALGGEAGPVLLRSLSALGSRIDPACSVSHSNWTISGPAMNSTVAQNYCSVAKFSWLESEPPARVRNRLRLPRTIGTDDATCPECPKPVNPGL